MRLRKVNSEGSLYCDQFVSVCARDERADSIITSVILHIYVIQCLSFCLSLHLTFHNFFTPISHLVVLQSVEHRHLPDDV